jgi:hypothetical protein
VGKHPTTKGGNIKKRTEEEKSRELKDRKWERKREGGCRVARRKRDDGDGAVGRKFLS